MSWVESNWFIATSGISSVVGLFISVWVAIQLYQLRGSYVSRARLDEIQRSCEEALTGVNALAVDGTAESLKQARRELQSVRTHLEEAERYFPRDRKSSLKQKTPTIDAQTESVGDIMDRYSECQQALIVIRSFISEKNWR